MATGLKREMFSPEYQRSKALEELVDRFNRGDLDYLPTKDKEQIAMLAAQHGMDFDVESKPLRKGLFDMVDTALFGMVPNKWRPKSIGEDYFGESRADRIAGTLGTVVGIGGGLIGGLKGAAALGPKMASGLGTASTGVKGYAARGAQKAGEYSGAAMGKIKEGGRSLWDMTTEGGNALRSRVLNNQYYKGARDYDYKDLASRGREAYDDFDVRDFLSRGREFTGY